MAAAEADAGTTTHLVVFVHGLTGQVTTSNAAHGQAIAIQLRKLHASFPETALEFSTANAGCCGCSTFVWTSTVGVERGGKLLAEEVVLLAGKYLKLEQISFIAASLGGLFARQAVALLWDNTDPLLPNNIAPHAFVTLATPHLGVRCTNAIGCGCCFCFANCIGHTAGDLDFSNPCLFKLSTGNALEALRRFQIRVAYAPSEDDGVVAYATAAITGRQPQLASGNANTLREARDVGGDDQAAAEWIGEEGAAYYNGDSKAGQMQLTATNLLSMKWRVIDVMMPHKTLATLYPTQKDGQHENLFSLEVADDVLSHVLGGVNTA